MKITAQHDMVLHLIEAMEYSTFGIGITLKAKKVTFETEGEGAPWIEIEEDPDNPITPADWVMLGYYAGRD